MDGVKENVARNLFEYIYAGNIVHIIYLSDKLYLRLSCSQICCLGDSRRCNAVHSNQSHRKPACMQLNCAQQFAIA